MKINLPPGGKRLFQLRDFFMAPVFLKKTGRKRLDPAFALR
jgi:hypothetical protein